jgi:hypothetical protein
LPIDRLFGKRREQDLTSEDQRIASSNSNSNGSENNRKVRLSIFRGFDLISISCDWEKDSTERKLIVNWHPDKNPTKAGTARAKFGKHIQY